MMRNSRGYFLTTFFACCAVLGTVYYFQYAKGIHPCPLCIMQRIAFYGIGLSSLLGLLFSARSQYGHAFITLFSSFGIVMAGRQLYLQHLPAGQAPACAPSFNFMLKNFPLHQTLKTLFYGSGDCAIVHWQFLGLSMAGWSEVILLAILVSNLAAWAYTSRHSRCKNLAIEDAPSSYTQ